LVLVAVGVGLAVRGRMLDKAMKKAELTLRDRYQLGFKVSDYRFTGLRTVTLKRYGIEINRRLVNGQTTIVEVQDQLKVRDNRRALQLPIDVIDAGLTPNPR